MTKVAIVHRDTGFVTDICDEADKFEIYEGLDAQFKWCEVPDYTTYEHVMVNSEVIHHSEREDLRPIASVARQLAYGDFGDQLDMQFKDSLDGGTRWADHIKRAKEQNTAPSSIPEFVLNPKHIQLEGRSAWDPWVDNWVPPTR